MNFYVIIFCFILAGHFGGLLKMDLTVILALCGKCEGLLGVALAGFFLGASVVSVFPTGLLNSTGLCQN